jgi:hypothetical protein
MGQGDRLPCADLQNGLLQLKWIGGGVAPHHRQGEVIALTSDVYHDAIDTIYGGAADQANHAHGRNPSKQLGILRQGKVEGDGYGF